MFRPAQGVSSFTAEEQINLVVIYKLPLNPCSWAFKNCVHVRCNCHFASSAKVSINTQTNSR